MTARARGTRRGQRADRAAEQALLELLTHGLSEDEIEKMSKDADSHAEEDKKKRALA